MQSSSLINNIELKLEGVLICIHLVSFKTPTQREWMCLTILFRDLQARLLRGNFIVNPESVYKTHEELWDGEL